MANPNEWLAQIAATAQSVREAQQSFLDERAREMERLRGIKLLRLPVLILQGANPLIMNGDQPPLGQNAQGPDQGWVWSLKHLVIEGMTRGGTPDVLQITRQGRIIWELNGNQYAQTWGKAEITLNGGEFLGYQSVGTFAAAGKITIHGMAWQVPAEEAGKLMLWR